MAFVDLLGRGVVGWIWVWGWKEAFYEKLENGNCTEGRVWHDVDDRVR